MKKSLLLLGLASCALVVATGCNGGATSPPPPVATHLSVTPSSANATAGTAFNITVSALDNSGAVVTTYAGTVHFTSSDPQAVLPGNSLLTNGTGTFQVTFKTAGSQTVTASDPTNGLTSGTSSSISTAPAAVNHLSVTTSGTAFILGTPFSVVVSALDAFNNINPSYSGTVKFTSSDAQASLPGPSKLTNGTGTFSVTLNTAGNQTVTVTDTVTASITGSSSTLTVSGPATHFSITAPGSTTTRATFLFGVTALDAANNPAPSYSGTVHITSSDGKALLPANTPLVNGAADLSATLETAGSQTITATDVATASINGNSGPINVTAAPLLTITSSAPPNATVGSGYNPHEVRVCLEYSPTSTRPICIKWEERTESFFPLSSSGGVTPNGVTWNWAAAQGSSLPPGLTIANGSSEITGTPPAGSTGTYNVVITVTDTGTPPAQTSANYSITITNPPAPVVNATPAPQQGVENAPYTYTFTASGTQPFTWNESGALPNGLAFNDATGVLSGTPTVLGSFPINITASDQYKQNSAPANFTIVISQHGFVATGSMANARTSHTATLLCDLSSSSCANNKVLVAGGTDASTNALNSAELYDPSSGSFAATGTMGTPRTHFAATLLNNGKVLVSGGLDVDGNPLQTAELYDPSAGTFTATKGNMQFVHASHTATLLQTGKVLIAGWGNATAELYDPTTDTFTATGSMVQARVSHTATLLSSGKVLLAGGIQGAPPNTTVLAEAELYDPTSGTFTQTTGSLATAREGHAASLLSSGKVLVTGGLDSSGSAIATGEVFDPASESFTPTAGNLASARALQTSTTLADGTVLVTGGSNGTTPLTTAELYDPTAGTFSLAGTMGSARSSHTATLLSNGHVLVTGGASTSATAIATAEVYQ